MSRVVWVGVLLVVWVAAMCAMDALREWRRR